MIWCSRAHLLTLTTRLFLPCSSGCFIAACWQSEAAAETWRLLTCLNTRSSFHHRWLLWSAGLPFWDFCISEGYIHLDENYNVFFFFFSLLFSVKFSIPLEILPFWLTCLCRKTTQSGKLIAFQSVHVSNERVFVFGLKRGLIEDRENYKTNHNENNEASGIHNSTYWPQDLELLLFNL